MQPTGWVQWAEWLIWVNKQVILGGFLLCFIKTCHDASSNTLHLKHVMASYVIIKIHDITSSYNIVMSLVTSVTAHVVGHVTNWYKMGLHMVWVGSFTQDIRAVGLLKACTGSDASGASSWLEPTSFNCISHVNLCFCCMHAACHMCLSIPEKPRSATHSSTSTTSAGLQCLSVGAQVHLVWLEL